jgi:hypothetical protein
VKEVIQDDDGGHSGAGYHENIRVCERVVRCRREHDRSDNQYIIIFLLSFSVSSQCAGSEVKPLT